MNNCLADEITDEEIIEFFGTLNVKPLSTGQRNVYSYAAAQLVARNFQLPIEIARQLVAAIYIGKHRTS